ncbi:MAG: hypothetical protein IPO90_06675 [Flavobacteriales bacterium]|nr:hypothetical protein [Flavobacteriales bacterium]
MPVLLKNRSLNDRRGLALVLLIVFAFPISAQQSEHDIPSNDSLRGESTLYDFMKQGQVEGRFRLYNMMTINDGAPTDHHAVAFGGALGFTSQRWKGLRFKVSGGYTFDLASSELTLPDPVTGQPSRYEIGLFDIADPRKTNDVAYLQEFQLDWLSPSERSNLVFGKQSLNTPFLNAQDGRMHPSLFEGLWAKQRTKKGTAFEGGWIYRISPRSTSTWYAVSESMDINPVGRDIHGKSSAYGDHIQSAGIFAASVKQALWRKVSATAWNVYTENVFNSALLQLDAGGREERWSASAMAIRQDPAARGACAHDSIAYMPATEASWAFSSRLRNVLGRFRWQLNYTRITAHGRYLMPREWGRDPFFTFLPRERNEGAGDVHAATLNLIWKDMKSGWRIQVDGGIYRMPTITDARLNKYTMPSYAQFDINAQYQFKGGWKGLAMQTLVLAKLPVGDEAVTAKQAFNKVDMLHADLIINYVF